MDIILTAYFSVLPLSKFLIIIGCGISAIIIYALYTFLDN